MSKENGFVPIRRGIWEHTRDGRMSPLEVLAFIYICSQADTRTGIWKGSAGALVHELDYKPRTARDVLERMEAGTYIRRFVRPGQRVCYPILVHKFPITQGEHNGEVVDALSSTIQNGYMDLHYFPREVGVEVHGEVDGEVSASQRRSEKEELRNKKKAAEQSACKSGVWTLLGFPPEKMPPPFREHAERLYAGKNGDSDAELVGALMEGWNALELGKHPPVLAQAASRIREQGKNPPARPIKFLPELPFKEKKVWPCQLKN